MSIFLKDCPQCTTANPSEAVFCACGYCFDPKRIRSNNDSFRFAAQEEKLYLDYLGARAKQAEADLAAAERQLAQEPDSTEKSAQVLLAQQALNSARADHGVQVLKLRNIANRPKTGKGKKKLRGAHSSAATNPAALVVAPRTPASPPAAVAVAASQTPVVARTPSPALKAAPTAVAAVAAPRKAAPPAAPSRPAPARKRASAPAVAHHVVAPVTAPRPVMAATPGAVFQAVQATKAEQVVAETARVNETPPQAVSPPALRPAGVAPRLLAAMKDCPHCTANLPLDTARCRCGFDFKASGTELPGLSMSAADLALFRNLALGNDG